MSYYDNLHDKTFLGYPVVTWTPKMTELKNPASTAFAIRMNWDEQENKVTWEGHFKAFIAAKGVEQVEAFIIGAWDFESARRINPIVEIVAANRDKLPNLKALYVGDIASEENEISWIQQGDLSPLLNAFPNLEHLVTRGGEGLSFGKINMPKLKSLKIESGGLDRSVVQTIGSAHLPEIEKIVIWLGAANYGANTTIADLQSFYECKNFPKLKYLGLCDSEIQDEIAAFMATAPVLERLDTLDLSMGTITDAGALALIKSPMIRKLKHLNLNHNFFSAEMLAKLKELEKDGLTLNVSENNRSDDQWRFVAVSE